MSESPKEYEYLCPFCNDWHIYKPIVVPHLYYNKEGKLYGGPKTSCNRRMIELLDVQHKPKFPFELDTIKMKDNEEPNMRRVSKTGSMRFC